MSDKDRRQKQINEMHEKAITGLLAIAQYRDFSAAKHEEIALYYAIGYLMSGKAERLDSEPTADVRENVKGEWLSGDCMGASCSKCGEYFSFRTFSEVHNFNFCPNCGADMRGEA